ncbi:MAG: hypothetical protein E7394_00390 [Ruminococcaceae bacterium]|nr:hypothetical protein [Oscillospiraceae bacterium]
MKFINSFLLENRKLFISIFVIWICASVSGVIFGSKLNNETYPDVFGMVTDSFADSPTVATMILNQADYLIKMFLIVIISSACVFFSPFIYFAAVLDAFSSGLGAALIVRTYSLKGSLMSFFIHVLPLSVSLPLYFVMFVSGLKFSLSSRSTIMHQRVFERRKQWASYIWFQLTVCICIFTVDVIKAFFCKGIIVFLN